MTVNKYKFSIPVWDIEDLKISKFFSVILTNSTSLQCQDQYENNQLICWNTSIRIKIVYMTKDKISNTFLVFGDPVYV